MSSALNTTPGDIGTFLGLNDFLILSQDVLDVVVKVDLDRPALLLDCHAQECFHLVTSSDFKVLLVQGQEFVLYLITGLCLEYMCIISSTNRP